MILSGSNTYSGGTTISAGTLQLNNALAAGTGAITLGDANTGASDIKLSLNNGKNSSNIVVSNNGTGNVTLYANTKYGGFQGSIVLNRDATFEIPNNASGDWWAEYKNLSGTGHLTILGGNTSTGNSSGVRITLPTANNGFSGGITVQSGRLQLGNANAAGTETIIVGNAHTGANSSELRIGAQIKNDIIFSADAPDSFSSISSWNGLQLIDSKLFINRDITLYGTSDRLTFNSAWSGAGNVTISGGRVTAATASPDWTGTLTVNSGSIFQFNGANALSEKNDVVNNGSLRLNSCSPTIGSLTGIGTLNSAYGSGTFRISEGDFSGIIENSAGVVSLEKIGAGTLTLSGTNTYTGPTTVTAGTLIAPSASALGGASSSLTIAKGAVFEPFSSGMVLPGDYTSNGEQVVALTVDLNDFSNLLMIDNAVTVNGNSVLGESFSFDITKTSGMENGYFPDWEVVSKFLKENGVSLLELSSALAEGTTMRDTISVDTYRELFDPASDAFFYAQWNPTGGEAGVGAYNLQVGVPEPSTWALLILGAFGIFGLYRRKR